jgi:AMMECR1 domain-containing protein
MRKSSILASLLLCLPVLLFIACRRFSGSSSAAVAPPEERRVRTRTVAGTFYPDQPDALSATVRLSAERPLAVDVSQNAIHDPRFSPVQPGELGAIQVSISVLDAPRPLEGFSGDAVAAKLGETRPGLIIEYQGRRSTFLPEVWEELPEPVEFLGHLCRKQGSPVGCWREPAARFQSYGSQHFLETGR